MVESGRRNGASAAALALFEKAVDVAVLAGLSKPELQTLLDTRYPDTRARVVTNGHAVVDYGESPEGRFPLPDDALIYREVPEGLIDLPTAVKKYGLKTRTVQDWVSQGHVAVHGRLRAPARGGGYLVVNEEELVAYITAPRK